MFGGGARGEGAGSGRGPARSGGKAKARSHAHEKGKSAQAKSQPKAQGKAQPTGRPGRRASIDPSGSVLGAVASRSGWVGAHLDPSGHGTPAILTANSLAELVDRAAGITAVAVDVPVGLPDDGPREADRQTRAFVGPQAASVYTTPVREAVYAATYGEANTINRDKVGSGVSRQAYELRGRIMELDAHLRQDLGYVVVETHPEACFAELAGSTVASRRRSADGSSERRALLAAAGIHAPTAAPVGTATEEMLDACAAAWVAHRVKTDQSRTIPEQPQTFSDGIPSAIHL